MESNEKQLKNLVPLAITTLGELLTGEDRKLAKDAACEILNRTGYDSNRRNVRGVLLFSDEVISDAELIKDSLGDKKRLSISENKENNKGK